MSSGGPLRGGLDEHQPAGRTRHGALEEQEPLLGVDGMDLDVRRGHPSTARPAGHAHALEPPARCRGTADRTRLAVVAVGTVARADTGEAVPLHDAGEALALAGADDIDDLPGLEQLDRELLAQGVLGRVGRAQLDGVPARGDPGLVEVALHRLGDLARVGRAVGDLHGVVPVGLWRADLGHDTRPGLDHRDRDDTVVFVPDLGHAELLAEQALQAGLDVSSHRWRVLYSLISMSTPAGRSRRMSESTVFGVGSMMSMSRLCVRISKCSRLSLYLCGERMTQYTLFSVGSGTGPAT